MLPDIGILHDGFVSRGAGCHRAVAVGPDGGRLAGAAADRQFRLGRHHLDLFARPGRRRQRAVAGRGRRAERPAMAGRGAGRDLVAAARRAYRDPHRGDRRRPALCGLRQGMGRRCAATDVRLPAEAGARHRSRWCLRSSSRRGFPATRCGSQDYLGVADPAGRHRRRGARRRAAQGVPRRSRQQGPGLRRRAVALVAASELLLRMVRLAGLSRDRAVVATAIYPWGWRRCWRRSSCTGSWSTSPASRRWRQQMLRSRGERYRDYQARTSAFFPLPPA